MTILRSFGNQMVSLDAAGDDVQAFDVETKMENQAVGSRGGDVSVIF